MKRDPRDSKGTRRDEMRVSGLALGIRSRVDGTKRTKRTESEESEILRNCEAPIGTPPVHHMWGLL